jgi:very-short-patch-repair endonuclease
MSVYFFEGGTFRDGNLVGADHVSSSIGTGRALHIFAKACFSTYVVDFAVSYRSFVFVVECDGHDFHDRTKQQAAYDRARDRELLRLGCPTLRFTGSEIVHAADRCANEIIDTLEATLEHRCREAHREWMRGEIGDDQRVDVGQLITGLLSEVC